ncbi:hypothetical protein FNF29_02365 [Cafeteria roenbergensis]|uniref:Uncharacterized protein n=1 Tax=Cafeteria roenbergensis TaxID=33653 RepID=A0A5A8CP51_CAFRO|nr:hypothetical protein FNF29_02365 [Cafeteria roenbergensis]|eukprot:KAA0154488.1 hypothetical protein FNF29_02365 [Cafeteria roenbergensis]
MSDCYASSTWANLPAMMGAAASSEGDALPSAAASLSPSVRPGALGAAAATAAGAPGCSPVSAEVSEPSDALSAPSPAQAAQSSADTAEDEDELALALALAEPVVDDIRTLTAAPDAVVSLSLRIATMNAALEAGDLLPLCARLCALRLYGPALGREAPSATSAAAAEALAAAPASVTALDLSGVAPHRLAVTAVVRTLAAVAPRLRALSLSGADVGTLEVNGGLSAQVLEPAASLSRLDLSSAAIAEPSVCGPVCRALATLTSLRVLDLSGNVLTTAASESLAAALRGDVAGVCVDTGGSGATSSASSVCDVTRPALAFAAAASGAGTVQIVPAVLGAAANRGGVVPPCSTDDLDSDSKPTEAVQGALSVSAKALPTLSLTDDDSAARPRLGSPEPPLVPADDEAATSLKLFPVASRSASANTSSTSEPPEHDAAATTPLPASHPGGPASTLRCLSLAGAAPTSPQVALALASSLGSASRLAVLSMARCDFGAGNGLPAQALARAIRACSATLRVLDLRACRLWAAGVAEVAGAIAEASGLSALCLADNDCGTENADGGDALARAFAHTPRLTDLDLSGNWLSDAAMASLGPALSALPRLRVLGLERNRIGAAGVEHLASRSGYHGQWQCLQSFRLGSNPLRAAGFAALAPLLGRLWQLQHLSLHTCRLGPEEVSKMALALPGSMVPPPGQPAEAGIAAAGSASGVEAAGAAGAATLRAGAAEARPLQAAAPPASATPGSLPRRPRAMSDGTSPRLRTLDIHDNSLPGHAGGAALHALLASRACDTLSFIDARQCEMDDDAAASLAAALGSLAWKVRRLRLDVRNNPRLAVLPRGLACLGELAVDHDTVREPVVLDGEDGVDALRRATAERDDSDSQCSSDDSDSDSDSDSDDGDQSGPESGGEPPAALSWAAQREAERQLREAAAAAAPSRPLPVLQPEEHDGPDVEEGADVDHDALSNLLFDDDDDS